MNIWNDGTLNGQNIAQYQQITQHFHSAGETLVSPKKPGSIWNVPFLHNPVFTGREEILALLHTHFRSDQTKPLSQLQALSGLGGVGKTQIAIEYAHHFRHEYHAVLWSRADNREALTSGYVDIARLLDLFKKDDQDLSLAVKEVLYWLTTHTHWLLVLDNADDLAAVRAFLPTTFDGHILLTTRSQAMGVLAHRIEVNTMNLEMGALLLLRRAKLIEMNAQLESVSPSMIASAKEISKELGGLPLALDQAGAYIEETGESLSGYIAIFRDERMTLLNRRGGVASDHIPVATTWNLAFENIELTSPAAIELMYLFAFLAPDSIPEEMLIKSAHHLGPILQILFTKKILFNDAIKILLNYSLIQRDASTRIVRIHHLVQTVIRNAMEKTKQAMWAERIVRMTYEIFPFEGPTEWVLGQRYLPQALLAVEYVDEWQFTFTQAKALLNNLGTYLHKHGQDSKAEVLLQRGLAISEKVATSDFDASVAICLNNLASLYRSQDKLEQAEPLLRRALMINKKTLGSKHISVSENLNNLANIYMEQGKLKTAEQMLIQAISIREKVLGIEHPSIVGHLCNLANIYRLQDHLEPAELALQRALAIQDRYLEPDHLDRIHVLQSLAFLFKQQGDLDKAEIHFHRAFTISEKSLGIDHPSSIQALSVLNEARQEKQK